MHVLAVAEKPSVAKELANIIGKGRADKVSKFRANDFSVNIPLARWTLEI